MKEKIFLTKWSEISGNRWDPKYINYQKRTKFFRYKPVELKKLILQEPMYGANEPSCERKSIKEPRYIRITDIDEFGNLKDEIGVTAKVIEKKYFLNENDLLFARSGATVGKTYIHKKKDYDCFFAGYLIKFVIDESKVDPNFIFYYTQLDIYKEWVKAIQRTSAQPNINAEEYKNLPIPLPPKTIQRKIIQKMENAYKQKEKAEQKAQELLDSIDDYILKELGIELPKIEEKDIKQRVFIRKWSEVSGNRWDSEYYKKSYKEFEKILKNFIPISKLTKFIASGSTPKSKDKDYLKNGEYHFLRLVDFNNNLEVELKNSLYVTEEIYNNLLRRVQLRYNDILFGIAGSIGKVAIYKHNQKAVINQAIAILRFKKDINIDYIAFILNSCIVKKQINRLQRPVAQPNLNIDELKSIKIPLPPKKTQDKIANYIQKIREKAKKIKEQALQNFEKTKKEIEKMLLKEKNDI